MKLGLGTVQFGMSYGIANTGGQTSRQEVASILELAAESGIDTLDTAMSYGTSESILGEVGVAEFKVVTKFPHADPLQFGALLEASLERLGLSKIHGLMLHDAADIINDADGAYADALGQLKSKKLVEKVGVSVYGPHDLERVFERFTPDVVQVPYNILDRRVETSGWLERLKQNGVEVHTRSAFLQGLLLMPLKAQSERFPAWSVLWNNWSNWLEQTGQTAASAALGFVLANPSVDRIIVGVDSRSHLKQLLSINAAEITPPDSLAVDDEKLINPANWNKT